MSEVCSLTSKDKEAAEDFMTLPAVLVTIDFSRGSQMEPIPRDFVFPGLPAGKVAILSAPGGTGKSYFLLELGMAVAAGEPLIHGLVPNSSGPVRYVSFEEDEIDLHNRLVALFQTFGTLRPPVERFFPSALEGESLPLLVGRDVGRGVMVNRAAVAWLERQCTGMRMVILDPLSRLHEADENSNSEMKALIKILIAVAKKTQCAIIVAHHTGKAAVLNGLADTQGSHRGASCIVDDPRLAMTLSKKPLSPERLRERKRKDKQGRYMSWSQMRAEEIEDNTLVLTWVKMNGHRPIPPMELVRTDNGILVAANGVQDRDRGGMRYEG